jgi:hypothetical protein
MTATTCSSTKDDDGLCQEDETLVCGMHVKDKNSFTDVQEADRDTKDVPIGGEARAWTLPRVAAAQKAQIRCSRCTSPTVKPVCQVQRNPKEVLKEVRKEVLKEVLKG